MVKSGSWKGEEVEKKQEKGMDNKRSVKNNVGQKKNL